ncbi:MAG TPA: hypothetical protein DC058_07870, partial [Planctomycetaceae bacterium]|nr:hypothetical protein [Planctomycetaceae bacterium]
MWCSLTVATGYRRTLLDPDAPSLVHSRGISSRSRILRGTGAHAAEQQGTHAEQQAEWQGTQEWRGNGGGTAGTQHFDRKVPGPKEGPAAVLLDTGTAGDTALRTAGDIDLVEQNGKQRDLSRPVLGETCGEPAG